MKNAALALTLAGMIALPALAGAAPKTSFITDAYAKQLVVKKVTSQYGHYGKGWNVKLTSGISPFSKLFQTQVKWGKGPHIMIAVPEPSGTVNMVKAPKAPQGPSRVTLFPLNP